MEYLKLDEDFCSPAISCLTPPPPARPFFPHTHTCRFIALDTLVPVSSWRAESCLSLCVYECMCTNVCVHSPSKACCSALLCWPGHVATLKLLSERPVKLLRSSTTLAVGSGNPSASCSLRTHTHTHPSLLHFPLSVSHVPPLMLTLAPFFCVRRRRCPLLLSVFVCRLLCFSCSLSPSLSFALSVSLTLSVPRSDRGICIIYVVKHHCGPSVSSGTGPAAHVFSCIPAQIAGNALWQPTWSHMWQ